MADASFNGRTPALIDGCRIPFAKSGTAYADLLTYDMARMALKALLNKTGLDPSQTDRVILGTVVQNVETSNLAREAALGAGFPESVPAHTVTLACISSSQAITSGMDLIRSGQADIVVAGGAESLSDIPIRFSKRFRKKLFEARKYKSPAEYLGLLKGLKPTDLLPDVPDIAEYSTGKVMGESADQLAAMFGVSREEQDAYALRSHQLAAKAFDEGKYDDEVVPAAVPPTFEVLERDNGLRPDSSMEQLAKLRPAFVKPFGTVTAGNSSFLTDGASAVLLMADEVAQAMGMQPKAYLNNYRYVAQSPGDELLLGPAYAVPQVMDEAGMEKDDIDVYELHEAFAGQLLAVLRALESEKFAEEKLNRLKPFGEVPMDKINLWGGSLSLGHPFGATGARLVMTAANRLHDEDGQHALVSACAAGGQGVAMLVERAG